MNYKEDVFSLKLVQEVEKYPVLYNFKLVDYSKREAVDAAWEQVAMAMSDTPTSCKEKWRNIRTVLSRKLKRPPHGTGRANLKPYYLMDALQFVIPFVSNKHGDFSSNVPSPGSEANTTQTPGVDTNCECRFDHPTELRVDEEPDIQKCNSQKKRKLTKRTMSIGAADDAFVKYVEKKISEPQEENSRRMFLLSLLPDVQRLSAIKMRKFRRQVVDILDFLLDDETPGSSFTSPEISHSSNPNSAT